MTPDIEKQIRRRIETQDYEDAPYGVMELLLAEIDDLRSKIVALEKCSEFEFNQASDAARHIATLDKENTYRGRYIYDLEKRLAAREKELAASKMLYDLEVNHDRNIAGIINNKLNEVRQQLKASEQRLQEETYEWKNANDRLAGHHSKCTLERDTRIEASEQRGARLREALSESQDYAQHQRRDCLELSECVCGYQEWWDKSEAALAEPDSPSLAPSVEAKK